MAKLTYKITQNGKEYNVDFQEGSLLHRVFLYILKHGSITIAEASEAKIYTLSQRIKDLQKKFEEKGLEDFIYVYDEPNEERKGTHARYFFKGFGSPYENRAGVRKYKK